MLTSVCKSLILGLCLAEDLLYALLWSFLLPSLSTLSTIRRLVGPSAATCYRFTALIVWLTLRHQSSYSLFIFKLTGHVACDVHVSLSDCVFWGF